MNNHEKLFELLEKENSAENQVQINRIISEDKEAKILYDSYIKLSRVIKNSSHFSTNEIADYVLFKNDSQPENKNLASLSPLFESHLRDCKKCREEFKTLNSEYNEINSFVSSKFSEAASENKGQQYDKEKIRTKPRFNFSRYAFAAVVIIAFLYGSLFMISQFTMPEYYNLANLDNKTDIYVARGRITDDFQKSIRALDENNFIKAAGFLETDIRNNPNDETIFYSHYVLGLIYLQNAEKDFIGLFPHYNVEYAKSALLNFNSAIKHNTSGKFYNINLDSYFYSAKANLMLGKVDKAKKDLRRVIDNKGGKMKEAQDILIELK